VSALVWYTCARVPLLVCRQADVAAPAAHVSVLFCLYMLTCLCIHAWTLAGLCQAGSAARMCCWCSRACAHTLAHACHCLLFQVYEYLMRACALCAHSCSACMCRICACIWACGLHMVRASASLAPCSYVTHMEPSIRSTAHEAVLAVVKGLPHLRNMMLVSYAACLSSLNDDQHQVCACAPSAHVPLLLLPPWRVRVHVHAGACMHACACGCVCVFMWAGGVGLG